MSTKFRSLVITVLSTECITELFVFDFRYEAVHTVYKSVNACGQWRPSTACSCCINGHIYISACTLIHNGVTQNTGVNVSRTWNLYANNTSKSSFSYVLVKSSMRKSDRPYCAK